MECDTSRGCCSSCSDGYKHDGKCSCLDIKQSQPSPTGSVQPQPAPTGRAQPTPSGSVQPAPTGNVQLADGCKTTCPQGMTVDNCVCVEEESLTRSQMAGLAIGFFLAILVMVGVSSLLAFVIYLVWMRVENKKETTLSQELRSDLY